MPGAGAARFLPYPQIVAIDNNADDLDRIRKGLSRAGLPCLTLLYDKMEGLELPIHWRPERTRILFLDLNLGDIDTPKPSDVVEPLSEVIETLFGKKVERPFVIIFWTTYMGLIKKTMSRLYKRHPETPLPSSVTTLNKTPFLGDPEGQYAEDLAKKIEKAISSNKTFLAMMAWESEVAAAAGRTYDRLHGLVAKKQTNGNSLKALDLQDILRNIAKEAWGKDNAKENPGAAITSGLTPILRDHLDSISNDKNYNGKWSTALKGDWDRKLPDHVTEADLNSHCLVDLSCKDLNNRGVWIEFTDKALRRRTFWEKTFGASKVDLIKEFVNCDESKKHLKIRNSIRLGLLEFTAACDRVNNKAPLMKFGLCAKVPLGLKEHVCWQGPAGKRYKKHDAIHRIETISIKGKKYILFVDYKYVLSLPPSHELLSTYLTKPIFRIRSQVLTDITTRYANHTTRPGIYYFPTKK